MNDGLSVAALALLLPSSQRKLVPCPRQVLPYPALLPDAAALSPPTA